MANQSLADLTPAVALADADLFYMVHAGPVDRSVRADLIKSYIGALQAANNLSDLANAAAARGHLGLGTTAVLDAGAGAFNVPALDAFSRLPAVDGSLLTNLPHTPPAGSANAAQFNNGAGAFAGSSKVLVSATGLTVGVQFGGLITLDGTTSNVSFTIQLPGGSELFYADAQNGRLGFFGVGGQSQQTANASLMDSTGGTPSTTVETVPDPLGTLGALVAACNDNFATMAAEFAKLRLLLTTYGLGT